MRAAPLLVSWHNDNAPIYSAHFDPRGRGRLATAGGDNNVRLWKVEASGEERKVTYLSTLVKHTQAVNVVRWCPRGEVLASAGDDGNVLLWVPAENQQLHAAGGGANSSSFGNDDGFEDKEIWRVKHMCRSFGSEIYDLAWSPDGVFFITGSMDNIARIYNAQTGQTVRQIAEHNHYVQGVAWDPLNEFVATQSSDRSVHIYTLKTKDGQFSLAQHGKVTKMDLPGAARRISSNSPAPPDFSGRAQFIADSAAASNNALGVGSPVPSAPGTPQALPIPMNPPPTSHSRRSSFGSSVSFRRSVSPAPSMPLPAVMPSTSPHIGPAHGSHGMASGVRNANLYANETLTSFFRRLTFAPDGSLLFTPAGQYKTAHLSSLSGHDLSSGMISSSKADDVVNTVYVYTRAGFNKPPVAYLPGHKKPSIAVRCSPIYYTLRNPAASGAALQTRHITVDTSSAEEEIPALPEPVMPSAAANRPGSSHAGPGTAPTPAASTVSSSMDPPPTMPAASTGAPSPFAGAPSPSPSVSSVAAGAETPRYGGLFAGDLEAKSEKDKNVDVSAATPGPPQPAFGLQYRMVYAVATQDAVYVYDTQQGKPLAVVSNLHFATFTDLTWSNDGLTLLMTSSDGFCSALTFAPGELGTQYHGPVGNHAAVTTGTATVPASSTSVSGKHVHHPSFINTSGGTSGTTPGPASSSAHSTPTPTPTSASASARPSQQPQGSQTAQQQQKFDGKELPPSFPASPSSFTPLTHPSVAAPSPAAAGAGSGGQRPPSPTRSMSASSIASSSVPPLPMPPTQQQQQPQTTAKGIGPGGEEIRLVGHPTPIIGSMPGVVAGPSGTGPGVATGAGASVSSSSGVQTPPATPMSGAGVAAAPPPLGSGVLGGGIQAGVSGGGGASASGSESGGGGGGGMGTKREAEGPLDEAGEGEGVEGNAAAGGAKKRRRIAPTLVGEGNEGAQEGR
ncbi:WD40-repeat-containing domain protein [Lineolata rhizophorae]|uniref:WD40-repeat-containing domain protein n=1 Tax=Lineolata rhizophorae TaxID=578093 RepID=A0A6A6NRJ4_9PEZI|nr:WD40-repeat-containing domain protein [Lineolata rhizophorae]